MSAFDTMLTTLFPAPWPTGRCDDAFVALEPPITDL